MNIGKVGSDAEAGCPTGPGFAVNRILVPMINEAIFALLKSGQGFFSYA